MVYKTKLRKGVIDILLQICPMVTGHSIIGTRRVFFGNFHIGKINFYATILM